MDLHPFIDRFKKRLAEVESALGDPSVFNHPQKSQELSREYNRLKSLVVQGDAFLKMEEEIRDNQELLELEPADSEMALMAKEDLVGLKAQLAELEVKLQDGDRAARPYRQSRHHRGNPGGGWRFESACFRRICFACSAATPKTSAGSSR